MSTGLYSGQPAQNLNIFHIAASKGGNIVIQSGINNAITYETDYSYVVELIPQLQESLSKLYESSSLKEPLDEMCNILREAHSKKDKGLFKKAIEKADNIKKLIDIGKLVIPAYNALSPHIRNTIGHIQDFISTFQNMHL